jgi:hypothetical protein
MNVTTISEDTIAHTGRLELNYILASVTRENGELVTGLAAYKFKVEALIFGLGGALVVISRLAGGAQEFYHIDVVPMHAYTLVSRTYIFGVSVTRGNSEGANTDNYTH